MDSRIIPQYIGIYKKEEQQMQNNRFSVQIGDDTFEVLHDRENVKLRYEQHFHMLKISCRFLDEVRDNIGLDFHYEIHFRARDSIVRLCCHLHPYESYKSLTQKQVKDQLTRAGKSHLLDLRETLAEKFKTAFAGYDHVIFAAKTKNYLGLIRCSICCDDFDRAVCESKTFLCETWETAKPIIRAVCLS